jgi:hypothetical protein
MIEAELLDLAVEMLLTAPQSTDGTRFISAEETELLMMILRTEREEKRLTNEPDAYNFRGL